MEDHHLSHRNQPVGWQTHRVAGMNSNSLVFFLGYLGVSLNGGTTTILGNTHIIIILWKDLSFSQVDIVGQTDYNALTCFFLGGDSLTTHHYVGELRNRLFKVIICPARCFQTGGSLEKTYFF